MEPEMATVARDPAANRYAIQGRHNAEKSILSFLSARNAEANGMIPQAAKDFAYSISVPHGTKAYRMPQVFTATPSALAQPWSVDEQDWTQPQPQVTRVVGLPDGEMFVATSRSPIHARIQYMPNPTNSTYIGSGKFPPHPALLTPGANYGGVNGSSFNGFFLLLANPNQTVTANLPFAGFRTDTASVYNPHGPMFFAATAAGKRTFYVPPRGSGDTNVFSFDITNVDVNGQSVGIDHSGQIHQYLLSGDEWILLNSTDYTIPSSTLSAYISVPAGINYAGTGGVQPGAHIAWGITSTGTTARALKIKVDWVHDCPTFGHIPVPGIYQKMASVGSVRPIAAALMLSPNSAMYQRQGLVRGVQLPAGTSWETVVRGGFNGLASAEGVWNGPWSDGIYAFLKPVGVAEFEMQNPFKIDSQLGPTSRIMDVDYPLQPPGAYLVAYAKVDLQTLSGTGTNYAAGASYTTITRCLEFRTFDTWFKQSYPQLEQPELDVAMRLITHMPQFHENPFHLAAISAFLRAAAGAAARVIPKVLRAVGPAAVGATVNAIAKERPEQARALDRAVTKGLRAVNNARNNLVEAANDAAVLNRKAPVGVAVAPARIRAAEKRRRRREAMRMA